MRRTVFLEGSREARLSAVEGLLVEMLARPYGERPFVVLSHPLSGRFAQFAGSRGEDLLLDVPALGYSRRMPETREGGELRAVVERAFDLLEQLVGGGLDRRMLQVELEWSAPN